MGISVLTAAIIQTRGDDIVCTAEGPDTNGKYAGWIILYRHGQYDHELLNTEAIYDTKDAAILAMKELVAEIRSLPDALKGITDILPKDTLDVVSKIVEAARGDAE